ncbi:EamA family transporter RarD [Magnetovibrio sp.]|uniref:EamA family transporter RarD n=1 Tax=Magnetovibrio sp. TaxID=2024836 RepID=UPI002F946F3A
MMQDLPNATQIRDSAQSASLAQGVSLALGATAMWGMFPLVFKTVAHIPALEVLAHRSAWSLVFVTLLMVAVGRRGEIFSKSFYAPRTLRTMALSGLAVATNWGIFIWAVAHDLVLQSSLGYYISPLMSVALGVVFLGERLHIAAWAAIALAVVGVSVLVINLGQVPWVSIGLAVSWSIYGLVRKTAPVGSLPGLYLETLLLLPVALSYIAWLPLHDGATTFGGSVADSALLAGTGLVTALPLLLFARATRILRLSTIGLLMYIVPTAQFLLAVFVFDEPFTTAHLIAFAFIWLGLAVYGWGSSRSRPVVAAE